MNQKKCPKCGEMNPGEAVMCWACYTPLTGAAVGAGAGGGGTAAVSTPGVIAHDDDGGQKKAIPPWQMGAVGVGLLLLLGVGAKTMMGGGGGGDGGDGGDGGTTNGVQRPLDRPDRPNGPVNVPSTNPNGPIGPSTTTVDPKPLPFTMAVPPNPASAWGVMAIVPTDSNIGATRAASLASFAAKMQARSGKWAAMHVYVFQDMASANMFKQYQVPRRSEALTAGDYNQLINLWPHCLARYEVNGGRESILYPSNAPNGWWAGRS